jgi:hypothetical protein
MAAFLLLAVFVASYGPIGGGDFKIGSDNGLCGPVPQRHWDRAHYYWFGKSNYLSAYLQLLKAVDERESCLTNLPISKRRNDALLANAADQVIAADLAHAAGHGAEATRALATGLRRLRQRLSKFSPADGVVLYAVASAALQGGEDAARGVWPIVTPTPDQVREMGGPG